MDWLGELKDEISDAIHNSLAEIVEKALTSGQELLKTGMNNNMAGNDGLFANFLTKHPSEFDATLSEGSEHAGELWQAMRTLSINAVVPIAGLIMAVVLLYELLQMVSDHNNFREPDLSIIARWGIKVLCGALLVSHMFDMASGFLAFGSYATNKAISTIFGLNGTYLSSVAEFHIDATDMTVAELLLDIILSGFLLIIIGAMLVIVIIVLASRMIEVFMYLTASPLPVATMMNRDWGEIGKNWIRNMVALGFQSFFIVIALSIFQTIFTAVLASIAATPAEPAAPAVPPVPGAPPAPAATPNLTLNLILLMGYALALCFTILKSGQISKSIFNAH